MSARWASVMALLASASAGAYAQPSAAEVQPPSVPVEVSFVLSNARCEAPDFSGLCRVVVIDQGFEHVHSRLWLEWVVLQKSGAWRRIRRVEVKESRGFYVLQPGPQGFSGRQVDFRTHHTYSGESGVATLEFGAPGRYRWIQRP